MEKRLFTSECVTNGHPDKVADSISDAILDACLAQDPGSRVACETMVTTDFCLICGEITTKALDLRGLLSALHLVEKGITSGDALRLGVINKAFDPFERQLVADAVWSRIPQDATRAQLFTA